MIITTLEPHPRRPDWWQIALDDGTPFILDNATVIAEGLVTGRTLDAADVTRLRALAEERTLLEAALRLLATRPRSRREVRQRLLRPRPHRTPPAAEVVDHVLDALTRMRALDDAAFAAYWVEQREHFSPRSAYALSQELRQRGVDRETITAATDPAPDEDRALAAARVRARSLPRDDYQAFRARLGGFLTRRGFGYGIANRVTRQLWQELGDQRAAVDDTGD